VIRWCRKHILNAKSGPLYHSCRSLRCLQGAVRQITRPSSRPPTVRRRCCGSTASSIRSRPRMRSGCCGAGPSTFAHTARPTTFGVAPLLELRAHCPPQSSDRPPRRIACLAAPRTCRRLCCMCHHPLRTVDPRCAPRPRDRRVRSSSAALPLPTATCTSPAIVAAAHGVSARRGCIRALRLPVGERELRSRRLDAWPGCVFIGPTAETIELSRRVRQGRKVEASRIGVP